MKRTLAVLLAFGLVGGALAAGPAEAKKKKKKKPKRVERVIKSEYQAPAIGSGSGVCFRPTNSCGDLPIGLHEKFVKVEIADTTGLPVYFNLGQDTDPDTFGTEKSYGSFCGSTGDEAIKILPGYPLVVFPWLLGPTCPSVGTSGTVTATVSNLP
ncbi:MAG TPA: hypothetical protein VM784_00950 [Actinomycetota bacterium]|nr:hypothetical protein [Actinomycetota bacterium]